MLYNFRNIKFVLLPLLAAFMCLFSSCNDVEKNFGDYINDGIKHTEEQHYDKAMASFKNAIKLEPDNAFAHYTLGGIYTFKDMNEDAITQYNKAIELDPNYPDPHYSVGFVYEKLGMNEEAKHEFARFDELKKKK